MGLNAYRDFTTEKCKFLPCVKQTVIGAQTHCHLKGLVCLFLFLAFSSSHFLGERIEHKKSGSLLYLGA